MIIQAATVCLLAPSLVYLGWGALGALLAVSFSYMVSSVAAMAMLYFRIVRRIDRNTTNNTNSDINATLKVVVELWRSSCHKQPFWAVCYLRLILSLWASTVDNALIGNYRIATNFTVLPTFFTIPIVTALVPAFSKLQPKK